VGGVTVPAVKPFQSRKLAFEILEDRIVPTAHWYLVAQAPQSNYEGDAVSLTVAADNQDGDPVTLAVSGLPSGLSLTYSDIYGQITGVVAPGASAGSPYDVTVAATDTVTNVTTSETIDWTVNQTIVTLTSPGDQTNVDGQSFGGLQVNASDSASHLVVFSATGLPSGLTIDPSTGTIGGNLANNASLYAPYSSTVTATDTVASVSASQTFNWTVSPPNVTLTSPGDQSNFDDDTVDLPISASDSVGNALSFAATGLPSGLSIDSGNGVISGTIASNADASGSYSVTLTATDSAADVSASQTITWGVSNPVALTSPGDQTNFDGDTVELPISASDSTGHALSFAATGLPSGLSIDSGSGVISGTIASDAWSATPYSTTVTAIDSTAGISANQSFTWTVAPLAHDATYSVLHDTILNIDLSADVDQNSTGSLTYNIVGGPSNGELLPNQDGTYDYQPNTHWIGTDAFSYEANDGTADSNIATVSVDVTNTAPTASDATYYVEEACTLTDIDLASLVSDADGDPLTISIASGPSHGQLTQNPDGTYIYTPDVYDSTGPDGFVGTDSFIFSTTDGVVTASATVTINVTQYAPGNGDGGYSILHDHTLENVNFAANDSDADGNPAAINIVAGPSNGTLTENDDGTYDYTPNAGWTGTDTVTVSANGGANIAVPIDVTDHAPVATQSSVSLLAYEGAVTGIDLLANGSDADGDALTVQITSEPQHGTLGYDSSTGSYDYQVTDSYTGNDSFVYQYSDGAMTSSAVTVEISSYNDITSLDGSGLENAAFVGAPSSAGVSQGSLNDCWFVAPEIGLATERGASFAAGAGANNTPIIVDNGAAGAGESYSVTFPGKSAVTFVYSPGTTYQDPNNAARQMSFATSDGNGDWTGILEQAWASLNAPTGSTLPIAISKVLDQGGFGSAGINALTGDTVTTNTTWCTFNSTTRTNLTNAFNNNKIVCAGTGSDPGNGLVDGHCYAVIGYNAATDQVQVQNPTGSNAPWEMLVYRPATATQPGGEYTQEQPALGGGAAAFWMPLTTFTASFSRIYYEQ
jgi:hypothetical protein